MLSRGANFCFLMYEYDDDDYYTYEFSEGNRKRIQLNLLFLTFSSLFCSTNLIFNCNLI